VTKKKVLFSDVTLRDGSQSLWAMRMTYGMHQVVASEIDRAGFDYVDLPVNAVNFKMWVRFFQEDPWLISQQFKEKFTRTKTMFPVLERIDLLGEAEPRAVVKRWYALLVESAGAKRHYMMCNSRNELDRYYPWVIPYVREQGLEFSPCICFYPSPRTTDEYYAKLTKRLVDEYKPEQLWLKDAGGLLSLDRIRTLLPAIQKEAKGIPIELHTHGMSTYQGLVVVEAMKLGVDGVHTCIPPLASGSSHISVFNAMHNARTLGLDHNITDVEALKVVEERLLRIAELEDLPIGKPLEYDHGVYSHQIPGGVISNLKSQLTQLGIGNKLDEVLAEVVQIIEDMGHPIMITPASQFIVSQAAVNVATGERYKEVLDSMIETALGVWGWEDAGVPWMNPNVRDRFLSQPNTKLLKKKYERTKEIGEQEGSVEALRKQYGLTGVSEKEFFMHHVMNGDAELRKIQPPKTYYTGKEPLALLLKELSKHRDVSRLQLRKGNSVFDYQRN
jgi:oxaloacetate decarboxylase (Na+ extruding) subunit alpha